MKNTVLRNWERKAAAIGIENGEYIHKDGRIVGGRAPNAKPLKDFYKKRDKFLRLRGKKKH